jgi:hypothetical protein
MNQTSLFIRIFRTLLKLYPIQFRCEFEEEMQSIFTAKVMDRASEGLTILTTACLREYFDLLYNLLYEYLNEFGKVGNMSHKGRIFFILAGCLFLAGGIFPWASAYSGTTVESFKGANETLLYLTGGLILAAGLIISGKFAKIISVVASIIGLGWGAYTAILLLAYFTNPPHFAQNSFYINLGPGLFLTLCASILSVIYGFFKFSSINKHPNILTIFPN